MPVIVHYVIFSATFETKKICTRSDNMNYKWDSGGIPLDTLTVSIYLSTCGYHDVLVAFFSTFP
jgi:hypothetical protein